jgi:membrane associated rhomboid family serine protease
LLVFFSLLFSIGSDIDFYSHIGGMVGGYLIALFLIPGIEEKRKLFDRVGLVGYAVFLFGTLLTFFLVK